MSVIINDFEIILEDSASPPARPEAATPPPKRSLKPAEVTHIIEQKKRRLQRLRAH